jgi:hypothetical protein
MRSWESVISTGPNGGSYEELYMQFDWQMSERFNLVEYLCDRWTEKIKKPPCTHTRSAVDTPNTRTNNSINARDSLPTRSPATFLKEETSFSRYDEYIITHSLPFYVCRIIHTFLTD